MRFLRTVYWKVGYLTVTCTGISEFIVWVKDVKGKWNLQKMDYRTLPCVAEGTDMNMKLQKCEVSEAAPVSRKSNDP